MIVWHRLRADFFMPSRLGEYARLLETALAEGYEVSGIERFRREATVPQDVPAERGPAAPAAPDGGAPAEPDRRPDERDATGGRGGARRLVLRHDVDTDPGTARAMWEIERRLGIAGSWFFRLSTRDDGLMAAIAAAGGEVGYHYEELATLAKRRHLRTRDEALAALPAARERFRSNLATLRSATHLPLRVAASHGDFVNRRLGVPNWMILQDRAFRAEVGIDLEGYDEDLLALMPIRTTDTAPPMRWRGGDPLEPIGRGAPVVYVLVHPRHWRAAPLVNARDDLGRLVEDAAYRLPRPSRDPRGR